jgi:hypothetical protein
MTDTSFPDRLSTNPKSPFYDEALLQKGVGIKFDGQEKTSRSTASARAGSGSRSARQSTARAIR